MLRCIKDTLLHKKKAVVTTPPAENQSTITNSNNSNSNTPTELPPPYQRYPLPPTSVPSTISSHSAEQLQHPPRPHQRPYPLPPTSVPSTVSTLSEQHQDQELDQVHPVAQETVNEPPTPTPDTSVPDPFTPKYVPYIDASPLKNNMFARNAGIYGRVNPDIMGGFGDDDNESVWLVDDEENQQHDSSSRPTSSANRPAQSNSRLSGPLSSHDSVAAQAQEPGPAPSSNAEPAFRYQRPSLLDDHDFTSDLLPSTTAVRKTPPSQDTTPAPRRGYAPVAASILNLGELGVEITDIPTSNSEDGTRLSNSRPQPAITSSASSSFANPYVALFEQQDDAMTIAYLRRLEQPGNEAADDFRFGQRYQKASDSSDVVITHQRTPRSDVVGDIECIVCADTKDADAFPRFSVTATCTHPPSTCLDCVQLSIESDLNGKLWTELRCPECRELLEYADIQRYANKQTFTRYGPDAYTAPAAADLK
ncbi:hypothetical protein NW762_009585 [Fusarium torreyae]|uniref:RING-type domain-containing protein n=1 Tax=Fusarium torreyae TaxID=1237075 RepID=A0A9W8VBT2_9HYPO|nr:hypothetical protein NW762_009585 [Fusarium torreyae]